MQLSQKAGTPMLQAPEESTEGGVDFDFVLADASKDIVSPHASVQVNVANSPAPRRSSGSPGKSLDGSPVSRRSFRQRTISDMTLHGVRHSFLTLTATALGGGMLACSFVMAQVGVGLGTLLVTIGALVAYLSTVALMRITATIGDCSFADLFSHCAGPKAGPILSAMLFIYGNGSCVNYFCFLSDFVPELVTLVAPAAPAWCSSRWLTIVVSALLIMPLALQKELSSLRFVTPFSIMSLVYVAGVIAARCPHYFSEHVHAADHAEYGQVKVFELNANVFKAFSICIFAFNCHMNVVPVAGRLVRPTKQRIKKVAAWVNILQLVFYLTIGVTGYLSFLAKTPGDILSGFEAYDPFIASGRFLLSLTMIVAVVLNINPTIRCGLQVYAYFLPDKCVLAPSPPASPRASPRTSPHNSFNVSRHSASQVLSPASSRCSQINEPVLPRICLTLVCLVVQVLVAIAVPNVANVISLLGATVATAMMMVIPAYAIGKELPYSIGNRCQQVVLLFFACMSFASVPLQILEMAQVVHS